MNQTFVLGVVGEFLAILFLFFKGFLLISWRKRLKTGEIDLLVRKGLKIYAIEVKTSFFRNKNRHFLPELRIDKRKVVAMFKAAKEIEGLFHVKKFHVKQNREVEIGFVAVEIFLYWPFLAFRFEPEICYF